MQQLPEQIKNLDEELDFLGSELVIGLVYAVGTDYRPVREAINRILNEYEYSVHNHRISELIGSLTDYPLEDTPEVRRISTRMDAGNKACKDAQRRDLWALAVAAEINKLRGSELFRQSGMQRTAHVIFSLKRPEEVATLRRIYGPGFFVIGVFATEQERLSFLIEHDAPKNEALALIKRDEDEENDDDVGDFGQQTRETFQLSDVFVQLKRGAYQAELERFFALIFCNPYVTPTEQEQAMFHAYAASLRSSQLGRQVGAAITNRAGDILGVGCNDVPKPGGGLYWAGPGDNRDHILRYDSNDRQKQTISSKLLGLLPQKVIADHPELSGQFNSALDITEFGRAVHAEMDALLTCARIGIAVKGSNLYTTTFPCHNCTRHIVAAGVERVIYIEPYAKSRAHELHDDAILVEEKSLGQSATRGHKVPFTHFVGIGPRRYFDLFSLHLSGGHELRRKLAGRVIDIKKKGAYPRVPLAASSYIERETLAVTQLATFSQKNASNND